MAHSRYNLAAVQELLRESDVHQVSREVDHGPVPADVEDRVVVLRADVAQQRRRRELLLDGLVLQEGRALRVGEGLERYIASILGIMRWGYKVRPGGGDAPSRCTGRWAD